MLMKSLDSMVFIARMPLFDLAERPKPVKAVIEDSPPNDCIPDEDDSEESCMLADEVYLSGNDNE